MKKLLLLAYLILAACTDPEEATRQLRIQNYTEITINGYKFTGCGKGDWYSTGFTAKSPSDMLVSGVVCCGLMKACTMRVW